MADTATSLKTCPGCGQQVWPVQEMTESMGFIDKCPRAECGAQFPKVAPVPAPAAQTVTLPHIVRPAPDIAPVISASVVGDAELKYIGAVLAECQQMTDADQIKQRLRRLSALVQ